MEQENDTMARIRDSLRTMERRMDELTRRLNRTKRKCRRRLLILQRRLDQLGIPRDPDEDLTAGISQLGRDDIKKGIGQIRFAVHRCYDRYHVPGMVRVHVTVDGATGTVTHAIPQGRFEETLTGNCVTRAVRQALFPRFNRPFQRFTYPFILR